MIILVLLGGFVKMEIAYGYRHVKLLKNTHVEETLSNPRLLYIFLGIVLATFFFPAGLLICYTAVFTFFLNQRNTSFTQMMFQIDSSVSDINSCAWRVFNGPSLQLTIHETVQHEGCLCSFIYYTNKHKQDLLFVLLNEQTWTDVLFIDFCSQIANFGKLFVYVPLLYLLNRIITYYILKSINRNIIKFIYVTFIFVHLCSFMFKYTRLAS